MQGLNKGIQFGPEVEVKSSRDEVSAFIHILKPEHTLSGLREAGVAFIEWKVPSFAFTDREVQNAYVAEATRIIHDTSEGKQPKERIWVNVTHGCRWRVGIDGKAYTDAELGKAVSNGLSSFMNPFITRHLKADS